MGVFVRRYIGFLIILLTTCTSTPLVLAFFCSCILISLVTLALLFVTHDWFTHLDNKKDACCIFFDFQKAIDTIPHKNLTDKLSQLEFHTLILKWIHSYLRNHEQ